MPAYAQRQTGTRPRERFAALAAVALVQFALGIALLNGLRVDLRRSPEVVQRLIELRLAPPPPPVTQVPVQKAATRKPAAAPKATPEALGGSPGPTPSHAMPSVPAIVALPAPSPPSGGGRGAGPAVGNGSGGGSGGQGYGEGEGGGSDLEQVAGEITPRDYPRHLGNAGIGGRVGLLFTVGTSGRVTRCIITRSSGIPELDVLTCRLIQQRFVFRPATDRYGRPVSDEVEGEHIWEAR